MTKSIFIALFIAALSLPVINVATATPSEQDRVYGGGKKGPVVFSFDAHARLGGYVCADCHAPDGTGLFENRRYEFSMKDHNSKKYCWSCHNGKEAPRSCKSCHY